MPQFGFGGNLPWVRCKGSVVCSVLLPLLDQAPFTELGSPGGSPQTLNTLIHDPNTSPLTVTLILILALALTLTLTLNSEHLPSRYHIQNQSSVKLLSG